MTESVDQRFAPPNAHVEDVAVDGEVLASRGQRFGAVLIDVLIAMAMGWALTRIPAYMAFVGAENTRPFDLHPWSFVASALIFLVLHGWLLVTRGQTIGKALLKLRIIRSDGSRAEPWRLLGLRYGIGYLLTVSTVVGSIYGLIDALLIFRESRKCLHDSIADTKVIKL